MRPSSEPSAIIGSKRPVQIEHVKILGYRIRVAVWPGDKQHTPLLIFGGIGSRLEFLAPFVEALRDIETITFDVPGIGESALPWHPYRLWMVALLTSRLSTNLVSVHKRAVLPSV